jgi:hypothetical protein
MPRTAQQQAPLLVRWVVVWADCVVVVTGRVIDIIYFYMMFIM